MMSLVSYKKMEFIDGSLLLTSWDVNNFHVICVLGYREKRKMLIWRLEECDQFGIASFSNRAELFTIEVFAICKLNGIMNDYMLLCMFIHYSTIVI